MDDTRYKRQKTKLRDRAKIVCLQDEVEALKKQIIALTGNNEEETSHRMAEKKTKSKYLNDYIEVSFIGIAVKVPYAVVDIMLNIFYLGIHY